jgi:hypothetical protein
MHVTSPPAKKTIAAGIEQEIPAKTGNLVSAPNNANEKRAVS